MEEQQWRSESVALDAPPTVQTTTVPAPKMPVGKQIPWKWVFGAGILVVALVAGLLFLRSNLAKNQEPTNNGQVKTQNVDLGKLAKNTTPLTLDKTDRVVINGQLQTTQGLVINPTAEPTTSVLGQVYLDSTTGDLRYYNGTTYLTIANSDAVGLTEVEVLALLTTFGTKLPQDLATTASPLFGGLKLNGTNGNAVLLQAAAGTANVTLTLPANGGTISQCLTTDGAGTLSFSACASGSGNALLQGGNAFATAVVLGTTDNNALNIITNNTTRLTVLATGNVGIGNGAPIWKLDVDGDINSSTGIRVGGALLCSASGCVAASGSNNYIQNSLNLQVANFHISSVDANSVTGIIRAIPLQTADLLQLKDLNGTNLVSVGSTGNTLIKPSVDATFAFSVQNALGTSLLIGADTIMSRVAVARALPANYTLDVGGDINTSTGLRVGNVLVCTLLSGCTAAAGSGSYIQNGTATQTASFAIQSAVNTDVVASIRGASGQSANLLEVVGIGALNVSLPIATFGSSGAILLQNAIDSTSAFQVKDLAGTALLTVDTSGSNLTIAASNSLFKAATNSTTAFQIQNAAGNNYLLVNTSGLSISVGDAGIASTIQIGNTTGAVAQTINVGTNTTASSTTTTTVGSKIGTSPTKIQAGTSGVVVQAADSVNAFSVQNAAGTATLFNIDTTNNIISIAGNNSAELQTWNTTTAMGATRSAQGTASDGSFIYAVGGLKAGTITDEVTYAPLNADGSVGTWSTTTVLPSAVKYPSVSIGNGFMYVVGGYTSGDVASKSVFYGKINSNGTISSWTDSSEKIITAVGAAATVAKSGYLYVMGGGTTVVGTVPATPSTSSDYARIYPDGSIGSFTAGTTLPLSRMGGAATTANGYMYFVGGHNGTVATSTIYKSTIPSDGTGALGAWSSVGTLNTARSYLGVSSNNGYLYAVGGGTPTAGNSSVEFGTLGSNGTVSTQTTAANALSSTAANYGGVAVVNGYFYVVGGVNNSGSPLTTVQYSSAPRIKMAGSLDLVGISGLTNGSTLSSSGTGGSLTAGDTSIVGRIRVTGSASFLQGMAINGDFYAGGSAVFRSTTNSDKAWQIQNAAGTPVLIADTVNSQIQPGATASKIEITPTVNTISMTGLANQFALALGNDGYPVFGVGIDGYGVQIFKCLNYSCSSRSSASPVNIGSSGLSGKNYALAVMDNNNPIVFYKDNNFSPAALRAVRCGASDCSSGNSASYTVENISGGSGTSVNAIIGPNGFPMAVHRAGSGAATGAYVTACTNATCTTDTTTGVNIGGASIGVAPQVALSYCSEVDRVAGANPNSCPIVASLRTGATDDIQITSCTNATCTTSSTATVDEAYTQSNFVGWFQLTVLSNGLPVVVRQIDTSRMEYVKCLTLTCSSYTSKIIVDGTGTFSETATSITGTVSSASGFNIMLGKDGLPLINYLDTSLTPDTVVTIQCGTETCDPASGLNIKTIINTGNGWPSDVIGHSNNSIMGGDSLPFMLSLSNTTIYVAHCVDLACSESNATTYSGGVSLGSQSNSFQSLYATTINDGLQGSFFPGFTLDHNRLVTANALTSDAAGNVKIKSGTATAFKIVNTNSGSVVLSVDSSDSTSSVNIGTSTSVAGYGFNSATASLFRNTTNSTSQFAVQNASSSSLFNLDSTNNRINLFSAMSAISAPASPAAAVPALNATPTVTPTGTAGATTYNYIIEAVTTIGNSAPSVAGTTATGNATLSSTNYNALSWTAFVPVSGTTTYYKIYRTVGGSTTGLVGTTTGLTFNDTGFVANGISITAGGALAASQAYFYKVTAIDSAGGESAASSEVTATTGASTKTIALTWTAVTGATGYKIYRSTTTNTQVFLTATGASPFTDNGSVTIGTGSAPSSGTAYKSTNNANSALQLVIGGNGTPTGQLYVSGTVPTSSVSSLAVGAGPNAVAVQGRYVYTTSFTAATLQVIDASIPSSPVILSTIATGIGPTSLVVQGAYVYVANQTSNTMQIYNVSNPAGPILVSTTSTGTTPREIKVVGRYAYVVNLGSNTLQIFDVANPATPVAVSSTATGSGPIGLVVRGNYAYIGHSGSNNMMVFDISSPTTPVLTGTVAVGALTYRMSIQGKYLYVASFFSNTLIIVDISNSYNPVLVSTTPTGTGPRGAVVNGRYVYVTNATTNTLQIFDVANPAAPVSLGTVATGTTPYAPVVNGRYVYLVNSGSNNLQIFDVGGAYIQQLETGGAEIGSLMVNNAAVFAAEASFQGGINTSGSLQTTADLGVAGNSLFKTSTNSSTAFQVQNATSVALLSVDTTGNGTISINAAADTGIINIGTAYSSVVTIGKSAGTGTLIVYGNTTVNGHIISGNNSGTTTFAVGAAACTGGVATSSAGNDTAGKIVVTTGASGCAAGTIVTVTFGATYTTAPMVVLTPGDSVTSGENLRYYATPAATTFVLGTQNTTTINKTLTFYYHVIR